MHALASWLLGIRLDCFLDPGADVGVVSSRSRLLYTQRNTSSVPQSMVLVDPRVSLNVLAEMSLCGSA